MRGLRRFFGASVLAALTACTGGSGKFEFWIYTSSYKEVLALYEPALAKAFPEVTIRFFQSGSENIAAKLNAELIGGATQADLLMTADMFYFQELARDHQFLPIEESPEVAKLPKAHLDPERRFLINRFPVMVIAYHKGKVAVADRPKSFADLTLPKYKGKITMPSPLESGTALTTILYLNNMKGESYFKALRENEMLSAGGNGAVMARLLSGERPIGMILMENILQARDRGVATVDFVLPSDGTLAMPSPLAILKSTRHPAIAQKVVRWMLGPEGTDILLKSRIYAPFPDAPPPTGAPAWKTISFAPWSMELFEKWGTERTQIKGMFQKVVLH